jgi:hypothetical protein
MDVDEIVAGLSEADRKALLQRLMLEVSPEEDEDEDEVGLEERLARLEQLLGPRGSRGKGRGPRRGYGPGWGYEGHHHCPHCGW